MRNLILAITVLATFQLSAQTSTWDNVYNILTTNCAGSGCHDGTGGRFDVGFLRDEAGYISRGGDVARIDRIGEDLERGAVSVGRGDGWRYECKRSWCNCRGYGHGTELHDDGCDGSAV